MFTFHDESHLKPANDFHVVRRFRLCRRDRYHRKYRRRYLLTSDYACSTYVITNVVMFSVVMFA